LVTDEHIFDSDYDAIIGLAYPQMADNGLPLMDSMIKQGLLHKNMFAFYMSMRNSDQSELLFGDYDESKFSGDIEWHPVVDQLFWSLKLDDIKINGKPIGLCEGRTCMMTPDSGTSLITMPSWAMAILERELPSNSKC